MRIGIAFDLKTPGQLPAGVPDDFQEEFDGPHTIEAIAQVLRDLGPSRGAAGRWPGVSPKVLADPPDFVFNFAEGQGSAVRGSPRAGRSRNARHPVHRLRSFDHGRDAR